MDTTEKPEPTPVGKMSEKRFYFFAISFIGYFALKNSDYGFLSTILFCCWVSASQPPSEPRKPLYSSFAEPTTLRQRLRNVAIILGVIGLIVAIIKSDKYLPSSWYGHPNKHRGFDETAKGMLHHPLGIIVIWTLILVLLRVMWVYRVHHPRSERFGADTVR